MKRARFVLAAASLLVMALGMAIVVAVDAPHPGSQYTPGSLPALEDGARVPVTAISDEGLKEPGALDPVPAEETAAEIEFSLSPDGPDPGEPSVAPTQPAPAPGTKLVALTAALPTDAGESYVMGVTWDDTKDVSIDARYLIDGEWGTWQALGIDGYKGEEGDSLPGTEPFIVTGAAALQVRASSATGVPSELTVEMFSSAGDESQVVPLSASGAVGYSRSAPAARFTGLPSGELPVPETALPGLVDNPMPTIHLRDEWNPRDPSGEFVNGTVRGVAVHHTAGSNSYSRSDVPGILRAIQRYHMDARDWYDIGYNFLIDKYGRIWEGRAGGVLNTIKGVHSHSFNGLVTGVSIMGNFQNHTPSRVSRDALVEFIAWKLTLHGVSADGRILHPTEGSFPAVIGHRDIPEAATACPGTKLYYRLSKLKARAIDLQNLPAIPLENDVNGDGMGDFVRVIEDSAVIYQAGAGPATESQPYSGAEAYTTSVSLYDQFAAGPPLNGAAGAEVLARRANDGLLFRMRDKAVAKPTVGVATNLVVPAGRLFASPGDLTGDGDPDVVLLNPATGALDVYPGNGDGTLGAAAAVSVGLGAVAAIASVGDVNADGNPDLAVIDAGGALTYLLGDGAGGLTTLATDVEGLSGYTELAAPGDLTGDGFDDLLARKTSNGAALTVVGGPHGATGELVPWDSGVATWQHPMGATGWGGDPGRTLIAVTSNGQYLTKPTPGSSRLSYAPSDMSVRVNGLSAAAIVGDYDEDGFADMVTLDDSGELRLRFGSEQGFTSSVVVPDPSGVGWQNYVSVTAAGDYNFDGTPDLAVTDVDGDVLVYTWDPTDPTVLVGPRRVQWHYSDYSVMGTGAWSPAGISDLLLVSPTGDLDILAGKGLTGARKLASVNANLPTGAQVFPLGQLPGLEGAAVAVYDPATDTFTAYGWTAADPWTPLPQVTIAP